MEKAPKQHHNAGAWQLRACLSQLVECVRHLPLCRALKTHTAADTSHLQPVLHQSPLANPQCPNLAPTEGQ